MAGTLPRLADSVSTPDEDEYRRIIAGHRREDERERSMKNYESRIGPGIDAEKVRW